MAALERRTLTFAIHGSVAPADVPALCERLRALLAAGGAEVVLCDVRELAGADAAAVDALARLQLTARRHGCHVELQGASRELAGLLAFVGLADVVPLALELRLEPGREPEQREDALRVEEERELDDPAV